MKKESEAVAFYHSLGRFGVQPGLERIRALCARLGDPQETLSCIHVAGTNGKGSTCTLLSSILQAAGYKVGLYTSPYVLDFRERIQINGEMIPEKALDDVTDVVRRETEALNAEGIYPTEFEAVTAAAFLYYRREACDFVVLETGLGGRFDATNLIQKPLVSVITSISLDHTKVLGSTIEQIAWEKSGIIKPGVPVVTSTRQDPKAIAVIRQTSTELAAPLILSEPTELFSVLDASLFGSRIEYENREIHFPFPGNHQLDNLGLALSAIEVLRRQNVTLTADAAKQGIESAFIPARTEIINREPLIILDGSHNIGGICALRDLLCRHLQNKRILALVGMMEDKDLESVTAVMCGVFDRIVTVTPTNPRSIEAERFADLFRQKGCPAKAASDIEDGVDLALRLLPDFDALIVCGSLYLASDIRTLLYNKVKLRYYKGGNKNDHDC